MRHALKNDRDSSAACWRLACQLGSAIARRRLGQSRKCWIASWGASQQIPEPQNALPADDLRDATVRQIFHLSAGGAALRVHLSNAFGTEALHFTSVHIARPVSRLSARRRSIAATDKALTFAGSERCDGAAGSGVCFRSGRISGGGAFRFGGDVSSGCAAGAGDRASGIAGDFVLRAWRFCCGGEFDGCRSTSTTGIR